MAQSTVAQFAAELGLPTTLLLEQLKSAGVVKLAMGDKIDEADKTALLIYLRKEHGAAQAPKNKITLTRKQNTEIKKTDSTGRERTIFIEVLKQRKITEQEIKRLMKEIVSSDEKRNHYFKMSEYALEELYGAGKNDLLDEDEKIMIRAALREKKAIKP